MRIALRDRHGVTVAEALVDDADHRWLSMHRWCRGGPRGMYARRGSTEGNVYMHRAIAGLRKGDAREVDHINGDKLDNRRENLRVIPGAAQTQNARAYGATSRFRGVCWDRSKSKWKATCRIAGHTRHLGRYDDEVVAAIVAELARRRYMPYSMPDPGLLYMEVA